MHFPSAQVYDLTPHASRRISTHHMTPVHSVPPSGYSSRAGPTCSGRDLQPRPFPFSSPLSQQPDAATSHVSERTRISHRGSRPISPPMLREMRQKQKVAFGHSGEKMITNSCAVGTEAKVVMQPQVLASSNVGVGG